MPIGRSLNRLVDLQTVSKSTDGEATVTYANSVTSIPAEVMYRGGGERVSGVEVVAEANRVVRMRFREDITAQTRLVVQSTGGNESLNVLAYGDPTGERREIIVQCKQEQST